MSTLQLINDIPKISLEGFRVVSKEMFAHVPQKTEPTCTIWYDSIAFSKTSLGALNNCGQILIEINPMTKCLLAVPVTAKDKDAIPWVKDLKKPSSRKIGCKNFSSQLYETWKLDSDMVYRTSGRIVSAENKIMLLFDFNKPEKWKRKKKAKT